MALPAEMGLYFDFNVTEDGIPYGCPGFEIFDSVHFNMSKLKPIICMTTAAIFLLKRNKKILITRQSATFCKALTILFRNADILNVCTKNVTFEN